MTPDAPITLNEATRRFELSTGGHTAHVEFARFDGGIAYLHTIVPKALEGRGIGSRLVKHVLDYALAQRLLVRPDCSFVHAYIDRHAEYQPISLAHGAAR